MTATGLGYREGAGIVLAIGCILAAGFAIGLVVGVLTGIGIGRWWCA